MMDLDPGPAKQNKQQVPDEQLVLDPAKDNKQPSATAIKAATTKLGSIDIQENTR